MWTLLVMVMGSYAQIPTTIDFYSREACLVAQKQVETKFKDVKCLCVAQGD